MEKKSGFVALIGRPNVGKSTLMNTLIGQKIAITSDKPQTTRNKIQTVYTDDRGQIVFEDTPGIHKARTKLGEYMTGVVKHTLRDVDLILWIVEASTYIGQSDMQIAENLKGSDKPVILAINKTDKLKSKEAVLEIIDKYSKLLEFTEIVPLSALKANNTDRLLEILYNYLPEGPYYYDEDTLTDQPLRQLAAELIREKALRYLSDEIPHGIAVEIVKMKNRSKTLVDIEADIICERESHKAIIIGKSGSKLKKIATTARKDIENLMDISVNLKVWVKVRKDWRDSDIQMKNFGYNIKDL